MPIRVSALKSELAKERAEGLSTTAAAARLAPDYAQEVLIAAWSETIVEGREPFDTYRPALKRALLALGESAGGLSRSSRDLAELVHAAEREHVADLEALEPKWATSADRRVIFAVSGARLQSTEFANELCSSLPTAMSYLAARALGSPTPTQLSPTAEAFAARLDALPDSRQLWRDLYLRVSFIISLNRRHPGIGFGPCVIGHGAYAQSNWGGRVSGTIAFTAEDFREQICFAGTSRRDDLDLVIRPVLDVGGGYVTSGALLLDSIAPRILQWIEGGGHWKKVITEPFEQRVIELARGAGLTAGTVLQSGFWRTMTPAGELATRMLQSGATCPGEIDVVAYDGEQLILLECKSLFPFGNAVNIAGKVSDEDIEGWTSNARKKVMWLERATGSPVGFAGIVVEGVQLVDTDATVNDVGLLDIDLLEHLVGGIAPAEPLAFAMSE